jgi:electron transport complex protein RnfC
VIKATNCVIAASRVDLQSRGEEMPCIRCGDCAEVCPARLLPQQLHWYIRSMDVDALEGLGLADCIECGCCDYVCPSQIPLVERFRIAKVGLREAHDDRARADTALTRFEARERRIATETAARQATLEQKRKALKQTR